MSKIENRESENPTQRASSRLCLWKIVQHDGTRRLHGTIGCVAPQVSLPGRRQQPFTARDPRGETVRPLRRLQRNAAQSGQPAIQPGIQLDRAQENVTLILSGETSG
jgi:hypothetical protein